MNEKDWEYKDTYTHYIAKVGEMYVQEIWINIGQVKLNHVESNAKRLNKVEAEYCKKNAGAKIRGIKVEVTYFEDDEFV
jgi:hypothetical protein